MKTFNTSSFFKVTAVALLFTLFGFAQQIQAQTLTITNTTNCWILVGEHAGNNCATICNAPPGTWIAPVTMAPFNVGTFAYPCFTTPPGGNWIGIKYAVASIVSPFPTVTSLGATSYTYNTFYPGGQCGFNLNNSVCGGPVLPFWTSGTNVIF